MQVKMNLNDGVKVKLTSFGETILSLYYGKYSDGVYEIPLDDDEYYCTQMWNLMSIFGKHIKFGSTDQPFDMNIVLENVIPIEETEKINYDSRYLSEKEQQILHHTTQAWNLFTELNQTHPTDQRDFGSSINNLQKIISMRMARKIEPQIFPTHTK